MRIRTRTDEKLGLVMVALRGASSPRTAESLRRVLDTALAVGLTKVVVDLLELDDVDPATALVLLECDDRLTAAGGWLWLVHGAGPAGSSLRFMGIHDRVPSSPSRQAAGWPGEQAGSRSQDVRPRTATAGSPGRNDRASAPGAVVHVALS
jgi:hypothetical protein